MCKTIITPGTLFNPLPEGNPFGITFLIVVCAHPDDDRIFYCCPATESNRKSPSFVQTASPRFWSGAGVWIDDDLINLFRVEAEPQPSVAESLRAEIENVVRGGRSSPSTDDELDFAYAVGDYLSQQVDRLVQRMDSRE